MTNADVTRLRELCEELVRRAESDPAGAAHLVDAVTELLDDEQRSKPTEARRPRPTVSTSKAAPRRGGRRATPVLDPFEVYHRNPEELPLRLGELDLEQLRDIVARYGMDPSRLVLKWKTPERVVSHIVDLVEVRSRKGGAFRAPEEPEPNIRPGLPLEADNTRRETMSIQWRRTELTRDLIRCDNCGAEADTVHFLTDGDYPRGQGMDARVDVVFACPAHSPEPDGYWVDLDRWFSTDEELPEHVEGKVWGPAALAAITKRFNGILRDAAEHDPGQ